MHKYMSPIHVNIYITVSTMSHDTASNWFDQSESTLF